MFCGSCGGQINEGDKVCSFCGTPVASSGDMNPPVYEQQSYSAETSDNVSSPIYDQPNYNYNVVNGENCSDIKTTSLLVFSILEILCCGPATLFGIISLVFWLAKLNPAVKRGDREVALSTKKTIKILLWVGLGIGILVFIGVFIFNLIVGMSVMNASLEMLDSSKSAFDELNSSLVEFDDYSNYYDDYDFEY